MESDFFFWVCGRPGSCVQRVLFDYESIKRKKKIHFNFHNNVLCQIFSHFIPKGIHVTLTEKSVFFRMLCFCKEMKFCFPNIL